MNNDLIYQLEYQTRSLNFPWTNHYPANICLSWRRLQHVFSVTILSLPRRLQDVLEDEKLLCGRRLEDALKTLWRQAKYLLGISVSSKSKCVSNKSIFNKSTFDNSKANPKCIKQNPSFQYLSYFGTQAASLSKN